MRHGPANNRLDFGRDPENDPENFDENFDGGVPGILKDFWMKFLGGVGRGPGNNRLDFGGVPDNDSNPYSFWIPVTIWIHKL